MTFSQLFFRSEGGGSREAARVALVALEGGKSPRSDAFALGDSFIGRSRQELGEQLGEELSSQAFSAPLGYWVGPLRSEFGHHLVRVEARQPSQLPALAEISIRLKGDLLEERRAAARATMLIKLRAKYGVGGKPSTAHLLAPALASEEGR